MLNPFHPPSTKSEVFRTGEPDSVINSIAAPAIWFVGYGAQIVLHGIFFSTFDTSLAEIGFDRGTLFIVFNCLIVSCSLVSMFGIVRYMTHLSIGIRIVMLVGSVAIFATTYFGFIMLCVAIAFS